MFSQPYLPLRSNIIGRVSRNNVYVDALVFLKFYHKKNDNSQKNVIQNSE